MTALLPEFAGLPVNVQLDGEIVALDDAGRPDFHRLSARMLHGKDGIAVRYFVFDVLACEGGATTHLPYEECRQLLEALEIDGPHWLPVANCDVDKFTEAFHDDAWIFFTDADGGLNKGLLTECFEEWAAPPRANIVGRLISVQQAGDVACVLLGFDDLADPTNCWVDFHLLLRIDGAWKITNKTATHSS